MLPGVCLHAFQAGRCRLPRCTAHPQGSFAFAFLPLLGLPVARGSDTGGKLALVLTGPFGAGQVRDVVARLRANGFPDAYPDVGPGRDQPSQMP